MKIRFPGKWLIVLTFSSIVLNYSCVTIIRDGVDKKISIDSGEIPPDMQTEKFAIIGVLHEKKSYDKYLEKGFGSYSGPYVLATENQVKGQYSNVSKT